MNTPRILQVEGWRGIPHSYAIVNQFQCLQFLIEPNLTLRHVDLPFADAAWKPVTGLFSPTVETTLASIPPPVVGEIPDAVYRISFPYNIRPSIARRTVVFGTAEHRVIAKQYITGERSLVDACNECDAIIVTPSHWSRDGFLVSGAPPERVKVVPHGINTALFHPALPAVRDEIRDKMGWNGFMFLSLGAMTENKGIEPLLKAFAVVAQKHPHVRMTLKGIGALYPSKAMFLKQARPLSQTELALIHPRLTYLQDTFSFNDIACIYQAADAYVSPYLAEGFNMPVLEAIACGVPVICTRGGSTDDFTSDDFALRVNSIRTAISPGPLAGGTKLTIDLDHLIHQMMTAVESPGLAAQARVKGPAFVANAFTWAHVKRQLLPILFDD